MKYDGLNCISSCSVDTNTYTDTSTASNLKCKLCNVNTNCLECTSSSYCTKCDNSTFLKSDNSLCLANCLSDAGNCFNWKFIFKVKLFEIICNSVVII